MLSPDVEADGEGGEQVAGDHGGDELARVVAARPPVE